MIQSILSVINKLGFKILNQGDHLSTYCIGNDVYLFKIDVFNGIDNTIYTSSSLENKKDNFTDILFTNYETIDGNDLLFILKKTSFNFVTRIDIQLPN